jgi:hypothetical protein
MERSFDKVLVDLRLMDEEVSSLCLELCYKANEITFAVDALAQATGDKAVKLMSDNLVKSGICNTYIGIMLSPQLSNKEKAELRNFRDALDTSDTVH